MYDYVHRQGAALALRQADARRKRVSPCKAGAEIPPAFPCAAPGYDGCDGHLQEGMTLRDYFAGQALAGHLASEEATTVPELAAALAYELADAMLAERAK